MELKRKYGDLVNVTIPDKSAPDPELLKDYKLPRSLSSYISSPADIEPLLSKNLNIDTEKQPYECTKCPKRFASQSKVDEHDTKYHFEHYLCPFCAKTYSLMKSEDFICHIYRHETGISKPHECIHCGFTCHRVRTMTCHIKTQGSFHTNRCPMCELSFESHGGFKQHLINVHPGQPGKICGYCGKVFNTDEDLTSHKSVEHVGIDNRSVGKKGVRKRLISSVSSSATTIKSESADPGALKICDLCGKEIKGSLKAHRDRVHGREENPVECPQCQKIFKSPWHLESHIKGLHDKYHCDLCGLMVSVKYKSRHFQQKHVSPEDRKFKCEVCAKGFSTGTGLRDHHNIHTGERPYVCKFCGKSFASSGNKEMHVRTTHLGHKRSYRS
jgi:KRAB domain-containing zinc finger protein